MVMYVHEPSLVVVLTKGKTITGTLPEFYDRLKALLNRHHFKPEFINREMILTREGFVISKTNNKSVLASMNAITDNIEWRCATFNSYDLLPVDDIEDSFMQWLTYDASRPYKYRCTEDYWKEKGLK